MAKKLEKYREMRDFAATTEPSGRAKAKNPKTKNPKARSPEGSKRKRSKTHKPRFVVQEHHARSLHWDLRLERDGVLVSWAVPKGIPMDPKRNHLAVHVEDHPLEYIDFAGEIPEGSYGAGTVEIWDEGTYEEHKFEDREVMVTLHGKRVEGRYVLFRTQGKNWMIHRMDPPEPGREPMPDRIVPMLAMLATLPAKDEGWAYELKWDGVRAILYAEGGRVRLASRNLRDITSQYPELRGLGRELGAREVILDGEIVAFDEDGRPSFGLLQRRMHVGSESAVRRLMKTLPVVYMAFDLLYLDGHSTMALPYEERRRLLEDLELGGPNWQAPAYHVGEGKALLEATKAQDLEGIVAKRFGSIYQPGRRTRDWLKVKNQLAQEFVIGGWLPGKGGRSGRIGALAVGYYDITQGATEATKAAATEEGRPQRLIYAGNVGTGFKEQDLVRLGELLEPLRRDTSPFEGRQPPKQTIFVEPSLVAEIAFRAWTHNKTLRAPSFKGLRDDKDPQDVVLEQPEAKGTG